MVTDYALNQKLENERLALDAQDQVFIDNLGARPFKPCTFEPIRNAYPVPIKGTQSAFEQIKIIYERSKQLIYNLNIRIGTEVGKYCHENFKPKTGAKPEQLVKNSAFEMIKNLNRRFTQWNFNLDLDIKE